MFAKSPLAQDAFAQLGGKTACGQGEYFYNELPRAGAVLPLPAGTPRERLSNADLRSRGARLYTRVPGVRLASGRALARRPVDQHQAPDRQRQAVWGETFILRYAWEPWQ